MSTTCPDGTLFVYGPDDKRAPYDPLHDDAQAMALVKRLRLTVETIEVDSWTVSTQEACTKHGEFFESSGGDLNRAICECVAATQKRERAQ